MASVCVERLGTIHRRRFNCWDSVMSIKAAASQHHQLLMLPFVSNCSNASVQTLLKSSSVFSDKPRGFRFDSLRCQYSASTDVSKDLSTQAEKGFLEPNAIERNVVRLGLPSKGRMTTDTLDLLKDCQLAVRQVNPRQYVADIPGLSKLEVWFQRENDVVRKLVTGDLDLGIIGFDTVSEFGQDNEDLILVHDALEYGECRLSIAIPKYGIFENISSMDELAAMPQWTENRPLRIATGFTYLGQKFVKEKGLKHVKFSRADGALEAAPAMGIADAILDLVGSGTTLRENNLKEIKGATVLESQGVFVASKRALLKRKDVLEAAHEMLERLEAHLRAVGQFTVTANMRGSSADEVAECVLKQTDFCGLQGPTVGPVFSKKNGEVKQDHYAIVICVPKKQLYDSVRQLRAIGGSGVLVSPLTYIFDEEPPRWRKLLDQLNL